MGDSGLNGDSERLWDLLKRELDANKDNINRVENRLLEKFDSLDRRLNDRDKAVALSAVRLDNVESKVNAHDKLLWIAISAVAITAGSFVLWVVTRLF